MIPFSLAKESGTDTPKDRAGRDEDQDDEEGQRLIYDPWKKRFYYKE